MHDWTFLWNTAPDGLLLDANGDGCVDGVAACIVPLGADAFTPEVWAACANFAARLGLESASIRLPLVGALTTILPWQLPVIVTLNPLASALADTPCANATHELLYQEGGSQVTWLRYRGGRALAVQAESAATMTALLNAMTGLDGTPPSDPGPHAHAPEAFELAQLFTTDSQGFYVAGADGYTPGDARVRIGLGPATGPGEGVAAIDLAARIGLESAGLTLPLAVALTAQPVGSGWLLLGFDPAQSVPPALECASNLALTVDTAHYLAAGYPFLSRSAQMEQAELDTVRELVAEVRSVVNAHPPQVKAALAAVQTGASEPFTSAAGPREVFSFAWQPQDGHDNLARMQAAFRDQVLPDLLTASAHRLRQDNAPPATLTVFCSAPRSARQQLQAEIAQRLRDADLRLGVTVLPSHKAALAWMREQQLPQLAGLSVAAVELGFAEFRPAAADARWLDLPTRWLQEWFPVQEIVCAELALSPEQVRLHMLPPTDSARQGIAAPAYRLTAYAQDGSVLYEAGLSVLFGERDYFAGMPEEGQVHPSRAGFILSGAEHGGVWPIATDEELFWDFYQQRVLPALRDHVLELSRGRPTPDNEPYFERLEIDGAFGWPDEALPLVEEFISVGEALHEDLYFNTLDYLAALGERFCGRSITAGGQVLPFIHDYLDAGGARAGQDGPRAVVSLYAWPLPAYVPAHGMVAGDRRDLPKPHKIEVNRLTVAARGDHVTQATVQLHYANRRAADFAGRVLGRWCAQGGTLMALPSHLSVEVQCCAAGKVVAAVHPPPAPSALTAPRDLVAADSQVIGPHQLQERLVELHDLPGVDVWQVGVSYQGRQGYVVDVTLPQAEGQTHTARTKLTLQKPTCVVIARHHANEVSSTTAALDLVAGLAADPELMPLLHRLNVVFLPIANPDGAALHYRLMAEHPRWKHHAARYNAAGKEFSQDTFDPDTPFGEARFRQAIWERWLPDAMVDNHGVPSHEWCQPFAGYNSPPRFPVSYHVVQAMIYGIIYYADAPGMPAHRAAAAALRAAVTGAVSGAPWLRAANQQWLACYDAYGHRWLPELSPKAVHNDMLFFYEGIDPTKQTAAWRSFALHYPTITLLDWITEVPDETAQGDYLARCAEAHRIANLAMFRLVAASAQPMTRQITRHADGRVHIAVTRERSIKE